ncbi:MAG TPA: pyruvate, water dikinase regulatory protein [Ornithinicoccus sp.]|nr:pyruvate, water dikinase regulatory protein [Ornithinicoccus sp.]
MNAHPLELHVVADSTGDTAARMARAAAAQYAAYDVRIVRHPRISSAEGLRAVIRNLDPTRARIAVYSTVVEQELRTLVAQLCAERGIPHADLLEPALTALEVATGAEPERVVRPVGVGEDYFKRIQAMEYAIANDDGQLTSPLRSADIVLVGVSRSGKTPLSMYLGYLGYRTANIPLVRGIAPPDELFRVERWKIVGLTLDPDRLKEIRQKRVRALGSRRQGDGYTELIRIYEELDEVSAIQRRLGCPVIDTTALALEEAAGRVIEIVDKRREAATGS